MQTFIDGRTQTFKTVHLAIQLWLAKNHLELYSTLSVPSADTRKTASYTNFSENKQLSKRSPLNPWKSHRENVNGFISSGIKGNGGR